jgi:ribosomal protein S7
MKNYHLQNKLYYFRLKFLNKIMKGGKKSKSFKILNKIFYLLYLKNKNNFRLFNAYFIILEPLFYLEKSIYVNKNRNNKNNNSVQRICFLTERKKLSVITNILTDSLSKSLINKNITISHLYTEEIYISLFKTSKSYQTYISQNENFLKLKNNMHYKWL